MFDFLPEYLAERTRIIGDNFGINDSGPVVVWLKSSHRFHENPAIDVGRTIANEMDLHCLFTMVSMKDTLGHHCATITLFWMRPLMFRDYAKARNQSLSTCC